MNDTQSPAPDGHNDPAAQPQAAFALRRRRLLKIGAGAAPASLLLVGRPVHAQYACLSTSAWGSTTVNPAAASVLARAKKNAVNIEVWSIADWKNGTDTSGVGKNPWKVAFNDTRKDVVATKTIANAGVVAPAGLSDTAKVLEVLANNNTFGQSMLVALLNVKHSGDAAALDCVQADTLDRLRVNGYQPTWRPGWSPADTIAYLKESGLAA